MKKSQIQTISLVYNKYNNLAMADRKLWKQIGHEKTQKTEEPFVKSPRSHSPLLKENLPEEKNDFLKQMEEIGLETITQVQQITQSEQINPTRTDIILEQKKHFDHFQTRRKILRSQKEIQNFRRILSSLNSYISMEKEDFNEFLVKLEQQIKQKVVNLWEIKVEKEKKVMMRNFEKVLEEKNKETKKYSEEIKFHETKNEELSETLRVYSNRISIFEREQTKLIQNKLQFQTKSQSLQVKLQDEKNINSEKNQLIQELQDEKLSLQVEVRSLRRKLDQLEESLSRQFDEQMEKVRKENQTIQSEFYLKEMDKLDQEISQIREKYHEKNEELERKQEQNNMKEIQLQKIQSQLEEQKEYLNSFQRQLVNWETQLKQQQLEIKKKKEQYESSVLSPKNKYLSERKYFNDTYESKAQKKSYLRAERDSSDRDEDFSWRFKESKVAPFGIRNHKKQAETFHEKLDDSEKPIFRSIKERRLENEINNLDSRLKTMQKEMKKQIQQLKRK